MATPPEPRPLGRRFWMVWTAATASNVGDGIVLAALPLLAAELTRQPLGVAATTIAVRLPWLLFGLFAGVIADRTDRLRLMIGTDAGRAIAFGAIALFVATGHLTLPGLYVAVFGIGVLETLFDTAAMSLTPSLVTPDQLEQANARINSAQLVANDFVGPPIGAALFGIAAALPLALDAFTFAVSVVLLLGVGGAYRPPSRRGHSVSGDIRDGFRFLLREPVIRALAFGAGAINLGYTAAVSVLVLHAQDDLGLDEVRFGLLLTTAAVGGVAGAQLAPRVIRRVGRWPSVLGAVAAIVAGIVVMGAANSFWMAGVGFAVVGFAGEIWNIVSVTYRQSATPDAMLGRVMSGFRVIAYGAFPVGAALGGIVASTVGLRATFFVGAGIVGALLPLLAVTAKRHNLGAS